MKRILLLAALLCSLSSIAGAQDYDKGFAAYARGNYATAMREWRPLAKQGVAKAQFNLGVMYERGQGVPKDSAEAVRWYRRAAEQGFAKAYFNLGNMYDMGQGVPQDYAEAYIWFSLAAAGGQETAPPRWRDSMAAKLTPDQLRDAQREAKRRWERIQARKK